MPDLWLYIDKVTGLIRTDGVAERAEKAQKLLDAAFADADPETAYPDSLNEYQWGCLELASDAMKHVTALKNFDGWAVCCKREDREFIESFDDDVFDWFRNVDFSDWDDMYAPVELTGSVPERRPRVGRKPKVPEVAKVYSRIFPTGHDGAPQKVVYHRLREHTQFSFSLSTLDRALRLVEEGSERQN